MTTNSTNTAKATSVTESAIPTEASVKKIIVDAIKSKASDFMHKNLTGQPVEQEYLLLLTDRSIKFPASSGVFSDNKFWTTLLESDSFRQQIEQELGIVRDEVAKSLGRPVIRASDIENLKAPGALISNTIEDNAFGVILTIHKNNTYTTGQPWTPKEAYEMSFEVAASVITKASLEADQELIDFSKKIQARRGDGSSHTADQAAVATPAAKKGPSSKQ